MADIRDSIVFIQTGSGTGSGVVISSTEILTAEHVVRGASSVNVSVKGVGLVFASVVKTDQARDLALLRFTEPGARSIAKLPSGVFSQGGYPGDLGAPVMAVGYVNWISETTPIATFGNVGVVWNVVPGDHRTLQIDAGLTNGMSGGGVFDIAGNMVGIIQSTSASFGGNGRALAWEEINEALPSLRAG